MANGKEKQKQKHNLKLSNKNTRKLVCAAISVTASQRVKSVLMKWVELEHTQESVHYFPRGRCIIKYMLGDRV